MRRLFSILSLLLVVSLVSAQLRNAPTGGGTYSDQNQEEVQQQPKVKQFRKPVFRGVSAHVDVASPVMGIVFGKNVFNLEAQVDVNLFNRIFPIIEVGYTSAHKDIGAAKYHTDAPFFRLGLNYGLLKGYKNDDTERSLRSYPFLGVRYSFSPMNYKLDNVLISDDYWGGEQVRDFATPLLYAGWLEVVGGVRVDLIGGFTMGWSVRLLAALHTSKNVQKSALWYVPGYGSGNAGTSFTFNYTIGYTFYAKSKEKSDK